MSENPSVFADVSIPRAGARDLVTNYYPLATNKKDTCVEDSTQEEVLTEGEESADAHARDPHGDATVATRQQVTTRRTLRSDQAEAIDAVRLAYRNGIRRVCLMAPTGWGKTIVAADVVRRNLARGKRTTFVVDGLDLVDQTVTRFYEEGITDVGVIQRDHAMTNWSRPVQVASVQTLTARKLFPKSDVVIIDECHVLYAHHKAWLTSPDRGDTLFVGLSATPYTKGLGDYFDTLIPAGTTQDMIDRGILCRPRVFSCGHPSLKGVLKGVKVTAGEYQKDQLSKAMQDKELTGDVVRTWLSQWGRENGKTLVFGVDRVHAQSLQQRFEEEGVRCAYQDGDTPRVSGENRFTGKFEVGREEIRRKFHSGEVQVVCSVGTMTKGIDWEVRCISLARPTKSPILFKQIIGRGLRTAPGKDWCLVLDHGRCTQELGFVTDIECDHLHKSKGEDGKAVKPKKFVIKYAKECPSCHALRPKGSQKCVECGFQPTAQTPWIETDDALEEVDRATLPKGKKDELSEKDKKYFYQQLICACRNRGYKDGWAAVKYKEKFGGWPPRSWNMLLPCEVTYAVAQWIKHTNIRYAKKMNGASRT